MSGFHRHAAYKRTGATEAPVEVDTGTWEEAWLAGWLSNIDQQGARYTNADKRKATEKALLYFKKESNVAIAERIHVSDELVRKMRAALVAVKMLEPEMEVKGRDGATSPSRIKHSSKNAKSSPTVGEDSSKSQNKSSAPKTSPPHPTPGTPAPQSRLPDNRAPVEVRERPRDDVEEQVTADEPVEAELESEPRPDRVAQAWEQHHGAAPRSLGAAPSSSDPSGAAPCSRFRRV